MYSLQGDVTLKPNEVSLSGKLEYFGNCQQLPFISINLKAEYRMLWETRKSYIEFSFDPYNLVQGLAIFL